MDGTVSINANSTTVTGTNTDFLTGKQNLRVGDTINLVKELKLLVYLIKRDMMQTHLLQLLQSTSDTELTDWNIFNVHNLILEKLVMLIYLRCKCTNNIYIGNHWIVILKMV